jgi:hypothetical protein
MPSIELSDEQAAALKAKAAAQGLTLEAWFQKLAESGAVGIIPSLDWPQGPAVESVPGKVSGAWVLKGTRMSVSVIFENLEAGAVSTTSWNGMTGWIANRSGAYRIRGPQPG